MYLNPNQKFREENYWFTTGWTAAVAAIAGTTNGQILLSGDADFKCYYISMAVRQAGLIVLTFAGDVQINEAQTGKNLSPIAIPVDALIGNGNLPYILPVPRVFSGNTTILFTFTSNVATSTQFNVVLHGTKLYPI
jgi:hypothetical protein